MYRQVKDRLALLPDTIFWDTPPEGIEEVQFQANSGLADTLEALTRTFSVTEPWGKSWEPYNKWWTWRSRSHDGIALYVYADRDTPPPEPKEWQGNG